MKSEFYRVDGILSEVKCQQLFGDRKVNIQDNQLDLCIGEEFLNACKELKTKPKPLFLEKLFVEEVPLMFCYPQSEQNIPPVFFIHDFEEKKEDHFNDALKLAQEGFFVILADLPLHGERKTKDFDIQFVFDTNPLNRFKKKISIIKKMIEEFKIILNHIKKGPHKISEFIGIIGFSLGANAALMAAISISSIKAVISISPIIDILKQLGLETLNTEEIQSINKHDPIDFCHQVYPAALLLLSGLSDKQINILKMKELDKKLIQIYQKSPEHYGYKSYPGIGHFIAPMMLKKSSLWFKRFLQ